MAANENLDKAIRIRVDDELKKVIAEAARLSGRPEQEYTRHVLRLAHGLPVGPSDAEILERFQALKKHDSKKRLWEILKKRVTRKRTRAINRADWREA